MVNTSYSYSCHWDIKPQELGDITLWNRTLIFGLMIFEEMECQMLYNMNMMIRRQV